MSAVDELREAVGACCGSRVTAASAVTGGDVARAGRFVLADGRTVFAKSVTGAAPGQLAAEAAGLGWLRAGLAAGLGSDLPDEGGWPVQVAGVVGVVDDPPPSTGTGDVPAVAPTPPGPGGRRVLVLDWIEPGPPGPDRDAALGRGLAALHRSGAAGFGLGVTTWCGPLPQDNRPSPTWAEFYGERRLRPWARLAVESGHLDRRVAATVEQVADRLAELAGPPEPPARLHGDLWSGNVVDGRDGRPWLVDPAAHGGHREVDLAMLALFGGLSPTVVAAYEERFPLADGHRDRTGLWQLAPLLVHTVLFGGGYASAVRDRADRYA